jgi:hypothetical protein
MPCLAFRILPFLSSSSSLVGQASEEKQWTDFFLQRVILPLAWVTTEHACMHTYIPFPVQRLFPILPFSLLKEESKLVIFFFYTLRELSPSLWLSLPKRHACVICYNIWDSSDPTEQTFFSYNSIKPKVLSSVHSIVAAHTDCETEQCTSASISSTRRSQRA